jgi:hypothetical protein
MKGRTLSFHRHRKQLQQQAVTAERHTGLVWPYIGTIHHFLSGRDFLNPASTQDP